MDVTKLFLLVTVQIGNCSELRGNQKSAAFQEGIETPGPPGPEEGCQGHLAAATRSRTGAAADFTADHQVAQAPFSSVVIRGSLRVGNEDEQLLRCAAQSAGTVFPGRPVGPPGKGGTVQAAAFPASTAPVRNSPGRPTHGLGVEPLHSPGPPDKTGVFRIQPFQLVDVPQQMGPTPLLQAGVVVIGHVRRVQHRSGEPVHQPGVHTDTPGSLGEDQHGRSGQVPGQHLRGAAVADGEVRGGLPESLCQWP